MSEQILQVNHLGIGFRTHSGIHRLINNISFSIERGKTLALVGESGSGKSMTALSLLHLLPQEAGLTAKSQIFFGGEDISRYSNHAMTQCRGRRIAMIFQEPMTSLNPVQTIGQQIGEVLAHHFHLKKKAIFARTIELLSLVGISEPASRMQAYPHQLSGGMKQRVMIAMALAGEPDLLIADEPTTALDVTIQAQVLHLLREIAQRTGMSILLITHDLGVVRQLADEVALMYAGEIIERAPVDVFFREAKHPYSEKLFAALPELNKREQALAVLAGSVPSLAGVQTACRFAPRCSYAIGLCRTITPEAITFASGEEVRCHRYDTRYQEQFSSAPKQSVKSLAPAVSSSEAILHAKALSVHYPVKTNLFTRKKRWIKAVDGVDLTLYAGQTLALVGESGCGKTTVGRALLSLIPPTAGQVVYQGTILHSHSIKKMREVRHDLQIIFQDPFSSMNPRTLVHDIIAEGIRAFKLLTREADITARVGELLRLVGLHEEVMWRYPHEFSGGQRQRICIARALAVEPKVIICDEPTSALDISVQAQILNLLRELQARFGYSYLFISHNMSVVSYLADSVAVMYLGRIVEQGPAEAVLTSPRHPYTQALLAAVPSLYHQDTFSAPVGEAPSPISPPSGCHFHPRCPHAMPECKISYPEARHQKVGRGSHWVKCYLYPVDAVRDDQVDGPLAEASLFADDMSSSW